MNALITKDSKLTATVEDNGKGGTRILVKADTVVVGEATLGGRYNQVQAVAEFRKNPKRFNTKVDNVVDYAVLLKQLKLI